MGKGKYKYLAKNTLLFSISTFGSKFISFFLVPLYTNVLTTSEYGVADSIYTSASLLVFLASLCIADAVLRFAMDNKETGKGVFAFGLRVVIWGTSVIGFIILIFSFYNPMGWSKYIFVFLFLIVFTNSVNQVVSSYLRAIDKVAVVAAMGIVSTLVCVACNIVLLLVFKLQLIGFLISGVAGGAISSLLGLCIIFVSEKRILHFNCDKGLKKAMLIYSIPLIFNGMAWWLNNSLDRYFIIFFYGVSANGLYAIASKIPTILAMVNQIFNQAWNLSAIKEYDPNDNENFFSNIYGLYNFLLVIVSSALILFNLLLAKILFAKDFFAAWQYSSVLLLTAVFSALSGFWGSVFLVVKKSRIFAISTISAALINVILNLMLIPTYGPMGGAVATAISFMAVWLIRFFYARKYINIKINLIMDFVAYCLLIIQIILEHTNGHCYWGQCIVFVTILFIYKEQVFKIFVKLKTILGKN